MRVALALTVTVIVALVAGPPCAHADVRLAGVFGDHMVLQRDVPLPVWGRARAGERVRVSLGGATRSTTAGEDGAWRVELPAMQAGGPHRLTVHGDDTVRLEDVLVGEVWLCSGQSNMEMSVRASANAAEETAAATDDAIRHLKVPHRAEAEPRDDLVAAWTVCSPRTVGGFTACGYFMARALRARLHVPVGLLDASWGGTRIEPWMPREAFARAPSLADLARVAESKPEARSPALRHTTMLYNGMIHPLVGYRIRGAIWYQGESNRYDGAIYADKQQALIESWRALWGQGDFPFHYVQVAPFRYGNDAPTVLPELWEAQTAVLARVPNTGMVVTNDVATIDNIHPPDKQSVGERLARMALHRVYGRAMEDSGPTFRELAVEEGALRVRFDHARGLRTRDRRPPTCFEIAGPTTGFRPAEARVEGDAVVLTSGEVPAPCAMRFAWDKVAQPNLVNAAELPAGAFRAGEVPVPDFLGEVEEASGYTLAYDLDLAHLALAPRYDVDASASVGRFDRVAYLLELVPDAGGGTWIWVSMDAFTDDARKLAIPTAATGATFQQAVRHVTVRTNVEGVRPGRNLAGWIEFWPGNYGPVNAAKVPAASSTTWDFGDQPAGTASGYGCMQVHVPRAKQTLFAVNHWSAGGAGADLGIGNSALDPRATDWTFAANAGRYAHKRLRVFVRPRR